MEIKYSIVPWALPREEMPVKIELPEKFSFDQIRIEIPQNFVFVDFLNVVEVSTENNIAKITEIFKTKSIEAPSYFGFIIASTDIPQTLKTANNIWIHFFLDGKIIECLQLSARIFRPKLEVIDIVETIELIDEEEEYELPMKIKYIGFGDIKLKIEGEMKGKIVSEGDSIVNELLRRLWLLSVDEELPPSNENNSNLKIEEDVIEELITLMENKLKTEDISELTEILGEEDIKSLKKVFLNPETKKEFLNIVYARVEDLFIGLLSDLLEKHPTDNVKLANAQTNLLTKIDSHIETINTRLLYKDTLGNKYPPVEMPVKIVDKRSDRTKTVINMPLIIRKLEEEPFINVAEMNIEGDD